MSVYRRAQVFQGYDVRFLAPEHVRLTRAALWKKTLWRDDVPRYLDGKK